MDTFGEPNFNEFARNYRDAQAYHRRAGQFAEQGQGCSLVFNVASVALERYLVALCQLYGTEPLNHNYTCLMDSVEGVLDVPPALNSEIRSLDLIFGICSLENYYHGVPEETDAQRALNLCSQVRQLFDQERIAALQAGDDGYSRKLRSEDESGVGCAYACSGCSQSDGCLL